MLTLKIKTALPALVAASGILLGGVLTEARADALSEAAGQYRINASSHIAFSVGQVGGGGISGDFANFRGTFRLDGRDIGRSTVQFTLVPASVRTGEPRVEASCARTPSSTWPIFPRSRSNPRALPGPVKTAQGSMAC